MKRHKRDYRIIHLIRLITVALLVPVLLVVAYINQVMLRQSTDRLLTDEQGNLKVWVGSIDQNLSNAVTAASRLVMNNPNLVTLENAESSAERYYALTAILAQINTYSSLDFGLNEMFFYAESAGDQGFLTSSTIVGETGWNRYKMNERIREIVRGMAGEDNSRGWFFETVQGNEYLIYLVKHNGNYAGLWCSAEYLLSSIAESLDDSRRLYVGDREGQSHSGAMQFDYTEQAYVAGDGTRYIQVAAASSVADLYLVEHINEKVFLSSLVTLRNILLLLCLLLGLSLAVLHISFDRLFYRPIRRFLARMVGAASGGPPQQEQERTLLREIRVLNETFDEMIGELQELRIRAYEQKLDEQEIELQYLQIQIRPHYLVNVLNMLYSMAGMKQYAGIQSLCLYLVEYYRYLYSKRHLVSLADELRHVECYMKIQETRFPGAFQYTCVVDKSAGEVQIPALLLQTFLENSFKYGLDLDRQNNIRVKAEIREGMLEICIADDGPGYPDEMLRRVNNGETDGAQGTESIGIYNAYRRMKLIYGGRARLWLENRPGAVTSITLPLA